MTLLTYNRQLELVSLGLAKVQTANNLSTFKYANKVMYDYLWDLHPELVNCRGHVYDCTTGKLVTAAPQKSFNYLEKGTWGDAPLSTPVKAYTKYNGFMCCVSEHNGEIVVSTTGSTTSDYIQYAKEMLDLSCPVWRNLVLPDTTMLYEIIHPDDPHIVQEEQGAVLLGVRSKITGVYTPIIADARKYDQCYYEGTLKGILAIAAVNRSEGFMVYSEEYGVCKLKTPYYIGKKKLMRMNKRDVELMYNRPNAIADKLPVMWKTAVHTIRVGFSYNEWLEIPAQDRRKILEEITGE